MSNIITFGEIMMRLSTPGKSRFFQSNAFEINYGGSESNTASSLSIFGLKAQFVSRLPDTDLAKGALKELTKHGVGVDHVIYGGERLGLYFLEHGVMSRGSKVIYDRAHSGMASLEKGMIPWVEVLKGATWFHFSGITPGISKGAAEVCLEAVKEAKKQGITVSVDLNFRNNLWQYTKHPKATMTEIMKYCEVVMGGAEDLYQYFDLLPEGVLDSTQNPHTLSSYESVNGKLLDLFPNLKTTVYSLRESFNASHNSWSALLFEGRKVFQTKKHELTHIVDRVGAGDALTAGIIYGLHAYEGNLQKTLDFAVSASCLKHGIEGDVNLVSIDEVNELMNGNSNGRVQR